VRIIGGLKWQTIPVSFRDSIMSPKDGNSSLMDVFLKQMHAFKSDLSLERDVAKGANTQPPKGEERLASEREAPSAISQDSRIVTFTSGGIACRKMF
jgi:hypothetical protein